MENEGKIVELLSEMLHKFDVLTDEVVNLKGEMIGVKEEVFSVKEEVSSVKEEVSSVKQEVTSLKVEVTTVKDEVRKMNKRLGNIEHEIVKLNLISAENSRSIMKLADNNDRITRLEKEVFK